MELSSIGGLASALNAIRRAIMEAMSTLPEIAASADKLDETSFLLAVKFFAGKDAVKFKALEVPGCLIAKTTCAFDGPAGFLVRKYEPDGPFFDGSIPTSVILESSRIATAQDLTLYFAITPKEKVDKVKVRAVASWLCKPSTVCFLPD